MLDKTGVRTAGATVHFIDHDFFFIAVTENKKKGRGETMSSKITIIGAGSVGATIAYKLSYEDFASEIVMIDINKDKVEGEVMDIEQGTCFRSPISIIAGDYEDAKGL